MINEHLVKTSNNTIHLYANTTAIMIKLFITCITFSLDI